MRSWLVLSTCPTLLDAAGIDVPAHMQGRSLLPLLKGVSDEWPEEVFVQISEAQTGRAVRTQRWKCESMRRARVVPVRIHT